MSEAMKQAFGLVRRPWGVFYVKNKIAGAQTNLKTSDKHEAQRILHAPSASKVISSIELKNLTALGRGLPKARRFPALKRMATLTLAFSVSIREQVGRGTADLLSVVNNRWVAKAQFPSNFTHTVATDQKKQNLLLHVCKSHDQQVDNILHDQFAVEIDRIGRAQAMSESTINVVAVLIQRHEASVALD